MVNPRARNGGDDGCEENNVPYELSQVVVNDNDAVSCLTERTEANNLQRQPARAYESGHIVLPIYRLNAPCVDNSNLPSQVIVIERACIGGDGCDENNHVPYEFSQVVVHDNDLISCLTERTEADNFFQSQHAQAYQSGRIVHPYRLNAPCLDEANESSIESRNDRSPQQPNATQASILVSSGISATHGGIFPPPPEQLQQSFPVQTNVTMDMGNHQEAVMIHVGIINNGKKPNNEATDVAASALNDVVNNPPTLASLATSTSPQLPEVIMIQRSRPNLENSVASSSFVQTGGGDDNRPVRPSSYLPTEGGVNNPTNIALLEGAFNHFRSTALLLPDISSSLPTTSFDVQVIKPTRTNRSRLCRRRMSTRGKFIGIIALQSALLLAAIIVIFVLVLDRSNEKGTTTGNGKGVPASPNPTSVSTLSSIRARGNLICGVVEHQGFSMFSEATGTWSGFEVDLCRAVGAAIFGEDGHVNFTASNNGGRFIALQAQQVDLLAAAATYTMERDLYEATAKAGFTFSAPYLYNGFSFAGQPYFVQCADQRNITGNCSGLTICVQDNTTHVGIVEDLLPVSVIKLAPTQVDFYNSFVQGHCNVLAGEQFDLAEINVRQAGYSGNYSISKNLYSKEPLALVTRDDDAEWSDYVNWVFLALLTAENTTVTQETAQGAIANPATFDESLLWSYYAVATVGNYAEMYDRHLQSLVPRAPVNEQNHGTSPLMYSMPFGDINTVGPGPIVNGTLEKILQRGELRCGVGINPFFTTFTSAGQQWSGLDVYVCMAISSAIFNGIGSTRFIPMDTDVRFSALANDDIDILSRSTALTLQRDVKEFFTNVGFTFATSKYYGGLQFGGIPPYADCANRLDVTSSRCNGLLICVSNATTTSESVRRLFPEMFIILKPSEEAVYECLKNKESNVIAIFDSSNATVRNYYNGPYQEGEQRFSRDNVAPVTRQDDPQWSSFVNWIMHALFYAEEQGISQATYTEMPLVNLFGSKFSSMFQNAIRAVGSYGEIYNRSAGSGYPRTAINMLNVNPLGPQHYPPPGLFGLF